MTTGSGTYAMTAVAPDPRPRLHYRPHSKTDPRGFVSLREPPADSKDAAVPRRFREPPGDSKDAPGPVQLPRTGPAPRGRAHRIASKPHSKCIRWAAETPPQAPAQRLPRPGFPCVQNRPREIPSRRGPLSTIHRRARPPAVTAWMQLSNNTLREPCPTPVRLSAPLSDGRFISPVPARVYACGQKGQLGVLPQKSYYSAHVRSAAQIALTPYPTRVYVTRTNAQDLDQFQTGRTGNTTDAKLTPEAESGPIRRAS